jgi:hypothetical protein
VKLRAARVPHDDVPLASSSDHGSRAQIIRRAVKGLSDGERGPFVYIGDGIWDGRAATSLGSSISGVGNAAKHDQLTEVGAYAAVQDFIEPQVLLDHLEQVVARHDEGTSV